LGPRRLRAEPARRCHGVYRPVIPRSDRRVLQGEWPARTLRWDRPS